MDFRLSDDQMALGGLAREIFDKELSLDRLREIEAGPEWFDRKLWEVLARAGLLGVAVPEAFGGSGLGLIEICLLLQQVGRAVAPVPVLPSLVLGGLPVARFGTPEQQQRWLPALARGDLVLTAALVDAQADDVSRPATRARRAAQGWVLEGRKCLVPAAELADRILVPATAERGVAVFVVDPGSQGVSRVSQRTSSGERLSQVFLAGTRVADEDLLGGDERDGGEIACWLRDRALAATCATQLGVCERALEITTAHLRQREQFGVPIGSFQAVQHRAADCYIDLEAMRWTTWRAAWRLSQDAGAGREAAVAKFWAAEGGARIASAAQHLHGGLGVDRDYAIHRYFLWSKQLELSLGAATPQLVRLGLDLARTAPSESP